jgi:hypothetical protein
MKTRRKTRKGIARIMLYHDDLACEECLMESGAQIEELLRALASAEDPAPH